MQKVLITGGAGFIGHQVVNEIITSSDWNIYLIDRLSYAGDLNRVNEVIEESNNESRKRKVQKLWYESCFWQTGG